jgi:hypothetical protein
MPIDEAVFKALNDLRKELEDSHGAFRQEYLTAHAAMSDSVIELSVGQGKIATTLDTVLERVNKTNGFVGEHEGRLRLQEGMLAGMTDELKRLNESLVRQVKTCEETRSRQIPRLDAIETRNGQQDAIEQAREKSVARKIKYEVVNKLADKAVEAAILLAGYVALKLWIFKG